MSADAFDVPPVELASEGLKQRFDSVSPDGEGFETESKRYVLTTLDSLALKVVSTVALYSLDVYTDSDPSNSTVTVSLGGVPEEHALLLAARQFGDTTLILSENDVLRISCAGLRRCSMSPEAGSTCSVVLDGVGAFAKLART